LWSGKASRRSRLAEAFKLTIGQPAVHCFPGADPQFAGRTQKQGIDVKRQLDIGLDVSPDREPFSVESDQAVLKPKPEESVLGLSNAGGYILRQPLILIPANQPVLTE